MACLHSDIYFAFGPDPGSFVFYSPRYYRTGGCYEAVDHELRRAKKVYFAQCNERGYGAFCFNRYGSDSGWTTSQLKSKHPKLQAFISRWIDRVGASNISVTLGPGDSYIACVPSRDIFWEHGLDEKLVQKSYELDNVRHVALGFGGDWMVFSNGCVEWQLTNYTKLSEVLKNKDKNAKIQFVALNPWRREQYFLLLTDGTIFFNVDHSIRSALYSLLKEADVDVTHVNNSSSNIDRFASYAVPTQYPPPFPALALRGGYGNNTWSPSLQNMSRALMPKLRGRGRLRAFIRTLLGGAGDTIQGVITGVIAGVITSFIPGGEEGISSLCNVM